MPVANDACNLGGSIDLVVPLRRVWRWSAGAGRRGRGPAQLQAGAAAGAGVVRLAAHAHQQPRGLQAPAQACASLSLSLSACIFCVVRLCLRLPFTCCIATNIISCTCPTYTCTPPMRAFVLGFVYTGAQTCGTLVTTRGCARSLRRR